MKRLFVLETDGVGINIARCEVTPLELRTMLSLLLSQLDAGRLQLPNVDLVLPAPTQKLAPQHGLSLVPKEGETPDKEGA